MHAVCPPLGSWDGVCMAPCLTEPPMVHTQGYAGCRSRGPARSIQQNHGPSLIGLPRPACQATQKMVGSRLLCMLMSLQHRMQQQHRPCPGKPLQIHRPQLQLSQHQLPHRWHELKQ